MKEIDDIITVLNTYWDVTVVAKPKILYVVTPEKGATHDLNQGDLCLLYETSFTSDIVDVGSNYVEDTLLISLDVRSLKKGNTQLLFDEIRRIIHAQQNNPSDNIDFFHTINRRNMDDKNYMLYRFVADVKIKRWAVQP